MLLAPALHARLRSAALLVGLSGLLVVFVAGAGAAGTADPSFAPGGPVPAGRTLAGVAVADLNGDGKADLVAATTKSKTIDVLLGNGAAGFRAAPGSPVQVTSPDGVTVADFDDDGRVDLAIEGYDSKTITILLGNGAGGFRAGPGSPVRVAGSPLDVTAADVNGDRRLDLVVPTYRNRVTILLGGGAGRFSPAPRSPVTVGSHPSEAVAADFNGDRKSDLAVANSEAKNISILIGTGTGEFEAARSVAAGNGPRSLAVADLNRDHKLDLAVVSQYSGDVTILLGNGAGGFRRAAGSSIAVGRMPLAVAVADFDADGRPDIAVANYGADNVTILLGQGAGRFRPALDSPFAVPRASQLAVTDLNGDARPDLLAVSNCWGQACVDKPDLAGVRILLQTPSVPAIAAGRAFPGRRGVVFSTRGRITKLAAGGNRVAVMTAIKGACGRILVWTAPTAKSTSIKTREGCDEASTIRYSVRELAIGGGQVAWIGATGGNSLELLMHVAKLSGGAAKEIAYARNGYGAGGNPDGRWVGRLLGEGSLLAYNAWTLACSPERDYVCDWTEPSLRVAEPRLVRIVAGRVRVTKRGAGSYALSAVGGGRMAVESAGVVAVLSPSGSRVATVPALDGNPPRAIALSKARLAVARTFTLDLHNPTTGIKVKTIPLGPAAALRLVGVSTELALLRGPRRLVLVRLGDSRLLSLPVRPEIAAHVVDATLTEAGLFYAYNTPKASAKGQIVFEATAKLLGRF